MRTTRVSLLAMCVLAAACGGTNGGTGDGGTVAGDGGSTADGGVKADGGSVIDAGTGGSTKRGFISIGQSKVTVASTTVITANLSGSFFTTTAAATQTGCTETDIGPCIIKTCTTVDGGVSAPVDAGVTTFESAGTLSVTGSHIDGGISLAFGAQSYSGLWNDVVFNGGDSLSVSASGGTVPAFSGKAVVAPSLIEVTSPTCALGSCGTFDRTAAATITWTGGTTGTVRVFALTSTNADNLASVTCTYAATAGTATIPPGVLGRLHAGPGALQITNDSALSFTSGAYTIDYSLSAYGAAGSATFQ